MSKDYDLSDMFPNADEEEIEEELMDMLDD